jgi:hypothetical protein
MERLEVNVAVLQRRMDQRDHNGKYDLNHVDRAVLGLGNASGESNAGLHDQIDGLTLRVNKAEGCGSDESFEMD